MRTRRTKTLTATAAAEDRRNPMKPSPAAEATRGSTRPARRRCVPVAMRSTLDAGLLSAVWGRAAVSGAAGGPGQRRAPP